MKKRNIALMATTLAVSTAITNVSEACNSNTRWHVGVDVGLAQYKQERKKPVLPTYKEIQKLLDEYKANNIDNINDMALCFLYALYFSGEHSYDKSLRLTAANTNLANFNITINGAANNGALKVLVANKINAINTELTAMGLAQLGNTATIIQTQLPNIHGDNNGLNQQKHDAINFFTNLNNMNKIAGFSTQNDGLSSKGIDIQRLNQYRMLNNICINDLNDIKNAIAANMNELEQTEDDTIKDVTLLQRIQQFMSKRKYEYDNLFENNEQIKFILNHNEFDQWMNANWYAHNINGQAYGTKQEEFDNRLAAIKKSNSDTEAKMILPTEKTSSGRITSPAIEANFGVTRQFGKGILGAEIFVGVHTKDFKKKKSKDLYPYTQSRMPVYGAGIVRAGFMLGDRAEVYALGGARFNKLSPIVGAGVRLYSDTKSYFFKAEFQQTLGKKYPKGHTIKLGFGWTI